MKVCSCLVNPRACHETELNYLPTTEPKKIAVVGAGPAGLSASTIAAQRGHQVDLYDAASDIGGQFNMAKKIPGKEEFYETIRYFGKQIELHGVNLKLNTRVNAEDLMSQDYDHIIVCTGVNPRQPEIDGIDSPKAISYVDVLTEKVEVGKRVAIIGAGGIGFDVAEYLATEKDHSPSLSVAAYMDEWGVDMTYQNRGSLKTPEPDASPREIFLLKRSKGKFGKNLGKTTGWIHRSSLKMKKVNMVNMVTYQSIDARGLHITTPEGPQSLDVDHVVICAGQLSERTLADELQATGFAADCLHVIGGADEAAELDAKRAIDQGSRLAAEL